MFQYIQNYKDKLINYLTGINENIDWSDFINTNMALPREKFLNKIKSLVWVDKDIEYDNGTKENSNLFLYYTTLLNKYYPLFQSPNNSSETEAQIYILDIAEGENRISPLDDFIIDEIRNKLNVLCRLLSSMRIKYKLVSELDENAKLVIPTGSITYENPNLILNPNGSNGNSNLNNSTSSHSSHSSHPSYLLVADDFYNIYTQDDETEFNFLKLSIFQLTKNKEITMSEILNQRYGLIKLA